MRWNKVLVVFLTLAMLTSVFVIVYRDDNTAEAMWLNDGYTPGYNHWGNATNSKIIDYDHTGESTAVTINTTGLEANTDYYLFRPYYNDTDGNPGSFEWSQKLYSDTYGFIKIKTHATDPTWKTATFPLWRLDCAGMWIIDKDTTHDVNDPTSFGTYIWVNSSMDYTITDPADFFFGDNSSKTITVDPGTTGDGYMWVDLIYDGTIVHNYAQTRRWHNQTNSAGVYTLHPWFAIYNGSGTGAGNYTLRAYYDMDLHPHRYSYGGAQTGWGWNSTHNATGWGVSGYNATTVGPWDPPERNATSKEFRVKPGTLTTSVATANKTQYWSFPGEVDISIKDSAGVKIPCAGADGFLYCIVNKNGQNITGNLTCNVADGWLNISTPANNGWGRDTTGTHYIWGTNGTWKVFIWVDRNGDVTNDDKRQWLEEWNATVTFKVQKAPGVQFKWVDDDGSVGGVDVWGKGNKNNDGVIPYVPSIGNVPLTIQFQIIGDDHTYYGATAGISRTKAMENITLSGDALFTGSLDKIPGVAHTGTTWQVPVIPTMSQGGGTITISGSWKTITPAKNYGSFTKTLSIGGTNYLTNGSIVTVTPNEFEMGPDQTFTAEVTRADGVTNDYGTATLWYMGDVHDGTAGTPVYNANEHIAIDSYGFDGYTLGLNNSQQRDNQTRATSKNGAGFSAIRAPRNLTVYVDGGAAGKGYALIQMKAQTSLYVNAEAIASSPTSTMMAGKEYQKLFVNVTTNDNASAPTYPKSTEESQMQIVIIDETGKEVTNTLGSPRWANLKTRLAGHYTVVENNPYFLTEGTYTVYAYNRTATSEGQNGTLIIKRADVTCDKSPFIWGHDDNISATFSVMYDGEYVTGGVLVIDNISWADAKYNRTWVNSSFDGSSNNDPGAWGNASIELDSDEGFTNGVVTVNDITANHLPAGTYMKNITFWYKPQSWDGTDSPEFARTNGRVPVRVPTVSPSPSKVPMGKTTRVDVTVTGRGTLLPDIFVRIHGKGVDVNGTSGSDGIVALSVLPTSSGKMAIDVGETGRTVDTVITSTTWELEVKTDVSSVDEGDTFTVTVTRKADDAAVENADVTFYGVTQQTDSSGQTTFTAPGVTSDRDLTISVSAEGYPAASLTIRIIDKKQLSIAISGEKDDKGVYISPITITVYNDQGNLITGATVTVTGGDLTEPFTDTTIDGQVTFKVTVGEAKDYTISATFSGFTAAKDVTIKIKGTPGFELLTLLVAIGIALILLRRRKRH